MARHLDHKSLVALVHVIILLIKADHVIDVSEVQKLSELEQLYGFDRRVMAEAQRLTFAEAVSRLSLLDAPMRQQIKQSLVELAGADRQCVPGEALLLVALRYCLDQPDDIDCELLPNPYPAESSSPYVLYIENEPDAEVHAQLQRDQRLIRLSLQQYGFRLLYIEHLVAQLSLLDQPMLLKVLGYMASEFDDQQLQQIYQRMLQMDTSSFCSHVLVRGLQLTSIRQAGPSLLFHIGPAYLRIGVKEGVLPVIQRFLDEYGLRVSPGSIVPLLSIDADKGKLKYDGYFKSFFDLLVKAEPKESHMVVWPMKSEFEFPGVKRTLRLNQQEASLYTLILEYNYAHGCKGLPLCYTPEQRNIESLYRRIYCRKKFVETADVIFPDNLAPIRAKIERKMREQLSGLSNLEDFIPHNDGRQGYYRISALPRMVRIKPDNRSEAVEVGEYKW